VVRYASNCLEGFPNLAAVTASSEETHPKTTAWAQNSGSFANCFLIWAPDTATTCSYIETFVVPRKRVHIAVSNVGFGGTSFRKAE
jgi:uncharacterized protein YgiB involved in biofilm formation